MKANVVYGLSRTLNLGDFESVRVNVSLSMEMEGKTSPKDVERMYVSIKKFVDEKVAEEEERWKL